MELAMPERGLLQRGMDFFFPPKVSDLNGLRHFLAGEAAYLAQKSVIGYCRVKTLLAFEKLMKEAIFRDLLEVCRWEAYSLTLADTVIMAEGCLRPDDPGKRIAVAEGLRLLYADILNEATPTHRPQGWADRIAEFEQRFALSCQVAPQPPEQVIRATASVIHELAPIHTKLKRNDLEVIVGDLGFNMVALRSSMGKRFRIADLAAALAVRRTN